MGGVVSTFLENQLAQELRSHRVVVWYDSAEEYRRFFEDFAVPELGPVKKFGLGQGYFHLRRAVESADAGMRAGTANGERLLLYVPRERLAPKQNVLHPLEALGAIYSKSLDMLSREALKGLFPDDKVAEWRKLPAISLEKLDALATEASDIGPLEVVFGKVTGQELGYEFLRNSALAPQISEHQLVQLLRQILGRVFGVEVSSSLRAPGKIRDAFAQRVLLTEFLDDLRQIPEALRHHSLPTQAGQVAACRDLALRLRDNRSLDQEYRLWAGTAVETFQLRSVQYDAEQLGQRDTFEFEADYALEHVRDLALADRWTDASEWAIQRERSFWTATDDQRRLLWRAAQLATQLWQLADRFLRTAPKSLPPEAWVERYVSPGEAGTWRIDAATRQLDSFSKVLLDRPELDQIVALARSKAAEAERVMAERFLDAVRDAGGDLGSVPAQSEIYSRQVLPLLSGRKVIFVLADALRFEMGQALADSLSQTGVVEISHAVATPPTITKIGMAALVPGAENGIGLQVGPGGLVAVIGGEPLPTLTERLRRFTEALGSRVQDISLDDCLTVNEKALAKRLSQSDLLLLRAQDLDAIGEQDNLFHARTVMTQVIPNLQLAINRLARIGFDEVIITADHGFLLRDDVDDAMKLEVPGGVVLEKHRRCVVGNHLEPGPNHTVFNAADFGLSGDVDIAFPRGINIFKHPGNMCYLHGGLSLQELIIPVVRYTPNPPPNVTRKTAVVLELQGAKKITSALFRAKLSYQADSLFDQSATRRFRVVVVSGRNPVGRTIEASHGFHEPAGEVELANGESSLLSVYLTESLTGAGELEVQVADVEAGETILSKKVKYDLSF